MRLATEVTALESHLRHVHPVCYGAAVLFSDGTVAFASQKVVLEYGCTLDAVGQLANAIDRKAIHIKDHSEPCRPVMLVQCATDAHVAAVAEASKGMVVNAGAPYLAKKTEAPLSALPPPLTREQARGPADCAKARSLVPPSLPSPERARERPSIKAPFSPPPLSRKQAREWSLMPGHRTCSKNRGTVVSAAAAAANTRPSEGAGHLCQGYVTCTATATIV
jgi:hypothetical protein